MNFQICHFQNVKGWLTGLFTPFYTQTHKLQDFISQPCFLPVLTTVTAYLCVYLPCDCECVLGRLFSSASLQYFFSSLCITWLFHISLFISFRVPPLLVHHDVFLSFIVTRLSAHLCLFAITFCLIYSSKYEPPQMQTEPKASPFLLSQFPPSLSHITVVFL